MNGKGKWFLSFVGAMKIARNLAVSGRHDEWYRPTPAPSLRELSSECETEGVYYDERNRSKITESIKNVSKPLARRNHRTTLPQSALAGCQLPQGGSRETLPSNRVLAKIRGFGRFSSPLRDSECFTFHRSSKDTSIICGVCGISGPGWRSGPGGRRWPEWPGR